MLKNKLDRPYAILVADDEIVDRELFKVIFCADTYVVSEAHNGTEALKILESQNNFDVVVLDNSMPGMTGLEVCQRIRSQNRFDDLPVIMLTAVSESSFLAKAMAAGANDFVRKPCSTLELKARINSACALKRSWDKQRDAETRLRESVDNLEQLVEERTKQLIHTERLATLGTMAAGVAHEINNPNTFIRGNVDFLMLFWELAEPVLRKHANEDPSGRLERFIPESRRALEGIGEGSKRILSLVETLKNFGRQGSGVKQCVAILKLVLEAEKLLRTKIKKGVRLETDIPEGLALTCERQKLEQILVNLINNAYEAMLEAGMAPTEMIIVISAAKEGDQVRLSVADNGPGIPSDVAEKLFLPFFTTKSESGGTGLGLSIVRGIVEEHGGQITLNQHVETGAMFSLNFKV